MNSLPGISSPAEGALVHRGRVTERVPERGLFWIMDELTGDRRLLGMAELEIVRASSVLTTPNDRPQPNFPVSRIRRKSCPPMFGRWTP